MSFTEISQNRSLDAFIFRVKQSGWLYIEDEGTAVIQNQRNNSPSAGVTSQKIWILPSLTHFVSNRNHHISELELTQATIIMKNTLGVHHRRKQGPHVT